MAERRTWMAASLVAAAILLGAFVHGGLYEVRSEGPLLYRVNRFTGDITVMVCAVGGCRQIEPR